MPGSTSTTSASSSSMTSTIKMASSNSTQKSARSTSKAAASSPTLDQIAAIQQQLSSSSDLNPLSDLIQLCKRQARLGTPSSSPISTMEQKQAAVAILRSTKILSRSLQTLCAEDKVMLDQEVDSEGYLMSSGAKTSLSYNDTQRAVADWIRHRWNECIELFCALLGHNVEAVRIETLQLLVELQVSASSSLSRLHAAHVIDSPAASSSSSSRNGTSSESSPPQPQAQWSGSPWRALTLAIIAGPPKLAKLGSGEAGSRHSVSREDKIPEDVCDKFAESGLEEYDDVRFATLREISIALRRPSPSAIQNPFLRANTLTLLLKLTAIPTNASDLNNFLVEELSIPPLTSSLGKKSKSKSKSSGNKVVDDGDSDIEEEDEDDMTGWFSDSDNEDARAGATGTEKRRSADNKSATGLGKAAISANSKSRKKKRKTFHEGLHLLSVQKAAFSAAWLDLLLPRRQVADDGSSMGKATLIGGQLSLTATHEVLVRLHAQILPHLTKPTLLHDFLVACLDSKGATALLALNGIFTLITRHNLDYPQFYTRLYALLDASVLHVKYRSRFLRLLEVFLSSTHLSAALVASFIKRLSRLSLRSPPAAIASLVPLIYNLMKRHPRCLSLIHKEWNGDRLNLGPAGVQDPFDPNEKDPLKTNALESSIWEIASFGAAAAANHRIGDGGAAHQTQGGEAHYMGSLTSLVGIFAEPFTREKYNLDDFLDLTYGTLFETETRKTLAAPNNRPDAKKKVGIPALAYSLPGGFGAGTASDSHDQTKHNRVDIFPTFTGRLRATESKRKAEQEEQQEVEREEQERRSKLGLGINDDDEDEEEKEAREAIMALKSAERAKKRKIDQTGDHDLCARLFNFA